ncbi:hypothetical protein IGI04_001371, partial [Brassica rapa subsp. trilocularis]
MILVVKKQTSHFLSKKLIILVENVQKGKTASFSLLTGEIKAISRATVPPSASHRRLVRRRLLSQCSALSPPSTMKKKKPKNSPTQFPLKSPPQAPLKPPSQALSNSLEDCHPCEAPKIVSDAQIGSPADKVAQRSGVSSDLALVLTEVQANKIVIDELASDPSSASINTLSMQLESIPVITPQRSSVSVKDIVVASKEGLLSIAASQLEIVDAKINSMTPHQAVSNQEASSEGINLDVAPVQLAPAQIAPAQLVLEPAGRKTRRGRSKDKQKWKVVDQSAETTKKASTPPPPSPTGNTSSSAPLSEPQDGSEKEYKGMQRTENNQLSKLGTGKDKERGETSKTPYYLKSTRPRSGSANTRSSKSDVQPDSSDVESSDSELEE